MGVQSRLDRTYGILWLEGNEWGEADPRWTDHRTWARYSETASLFRNAMAQRLIDSRDSKAIDTS